MKIVIDSDFRCHLTDGEGMRQVKTDFFDGKCESFIEGFRFIPAGESWIRPDGEVFNGEMISAAENFEALVKAQTQYEADEEAYIAELGALIDEIYNVDMEVINNV